MVMMIWSIALTLHSAHVRQHPPLCTVQLYGVVRVDEINYFSNLAALRSPRPIGVRAASSLRPRRRAAPALPSTLPTPPHATQA
eukprot:5666580-Pleurochrysis_carterae.AAC.2